MVDEEKTSVGNDGRSLLLQLPNSINTSLQDILAAIQELENQKLTAENIQTLGGKWLLLWTSGTKKYQNLTKKSLDAPIITNSRKSQIIQYFDINQNRIENKVIFSFGSLTISGGFIYTPKKRIEFIFKQMSLQIGVLPVLNIPLGNWAKGWLQTTYLDSHIHIERGDRGGVSVYLKQL